MKNWIERLKCICTNKKINSYSLKMNLCILPAAVGLLVFYFLPFGKVILYSFIKGQYQKQFVGFFHYQSVLSNPYFRLALKNTFLMIIICVPIFLAGSILLSRISINGGLLGKMIGKISLLTFFVPSVSVAAVFKLLFSDINSPLPVYMMFLWKYMGMGVVILTAAILTIDHEIYDAARIDGAGTFTIYVRIILPLIMKPIRFTLVIAVVYCFRTFRESYLFYGQKYPPDYSYTLQYYMNNQFLKLNYQTMAAATVMITIVLATFVVLCSRSWKGKKSHGGD